MKKIIIFYGLIFLINIIFAQVVPVKGMTREHYTSAFGPRDKASGAESTRYDFHEGYDIAVTGS